MAFENRRFAAQTGYPYINQNLYVYKTPDDTVAQVSASGFFNNFFENLRIGDIIWVEASDSTTILRVTTENVQPVVTEAFKVGDIADNSITTDKIVNLAVTTTKINDDAVTTAKIGPDAVTNAELADNAVSLENLDADIRPQAIVTYSGTHITVGGAATEIVSVPGVTTADIGVGQVITQGATPRRVIAFTPGIDSVKFTFDGDPSTDHEVSYIVTSFTV